MTALARAAPETDVPRIAPHSFETLRDQAALQVERRTTGRLDWHAIACDPGRGFELLPPPSSGDVIFDIEGDPFWEPAQGLHFLFGLLLREGADWRYRPIWAHDRRGERAMFEQFVDLVHARLAADPQMHVYHYGTYENAALKQLMGTYATREDAVDELLRRNVFINLHTVVRQGLRAGVDSYSLKEVEALAAFARRADVRIGMDAVLAYEKWIKSQDAAMLASIADYNEEDCRATLALRDWLVEHHPADKSWADAIAAKEEPEQDGGEREALRQRLVEGEEPGSVRWLAGELLEYHQREARPGVVVVLRAPRPDDRRRSSSTTPKRSAVSSLPARWFPTRSRSFIRCGFRRSSTSCRRASNSSIPRPRGRRGQSSPSTT